MKFKYIFRKLYWLIALISIIFDSFIFISLPNLPMDIKLNSKFEEISMNTNDFLEETDAKLEELEKLKEQRKIESETQRAWRRKNELLRIREEERRLEEERVLYETNHSIEEPRNEYIYESEPGNEIIDESIAQNIEWYTIEVSYYCPCEICCGKTDGITASGFVAMEGVTVAVPDFIPLGTKIVIDGHEYIAQDRGGYIIALGNNTIRVDIFVSSHEKALAMGRYVTQGYIVWE